LQWAELIFVIERRHKEMILEKFDSASKYKFIVLDIENDYQYMNDELIEILKRSVDPYLKIKGSIH